MGVNQKIAALERDVARLSEDAQRLRERLYNALMQSGGQVDGPVTFADYLQLEAIPTVGTPQANRARIYTKDNGKLYCIDPAGTEFDCTVGGEPGGSPGVGDAEYIVLALHSELTAERRLVLGTGLEAVDGGANADYTMSITQADVDHDQIGGVSEADHHDPVTAGDGITVAAQVVTLGTPSTITVGTANAVTSTSHTHAITSSSNPGVAASILASDGSGILQLTRLIVGADDADRGDIILYGPGTGTAEGAQIYLYCAADYDNIIENWSIDVWQDDLRIFEGGNVRLFLQQGGNIGAGTITPNAPFEIHGNTFPQLRVHNEDVGSPAGEAGIRLRSYGNDANAHADIVFIGTGTNTGYVIIRVPHTVERARFLSDGRIGFGIVPSGGDLVQIGGDLGIDGDLNFIGAQSITTTVDNLTIAPAGDVVFDPVGNDLMPATAYDLNIGSMQKKYLTLHVAELWVETLVAQDTIATIGGRVLVGPTTMLARDLAAAATTIWVKHNEMASGDIAYLEADGRVEFISIDSGPTASAELLSNTSFDIFGAGGADIWANWIENAGDGALSYDGPGELIVGGGFSDDPEVNENWIPLYCTLASVAGGQAGNCLEMTRTSFNYQFARQAFSFVGGRTYRLTFYVKSGTSGDETFWVGVGEYGVDWGDPVIGTTTSSWVQYTLVFEAKDTYDMVYLMKWSSTAGTMLFDTVSMTWGVCKATAGVSANTYVRQAGTVTAGSRYKVDFWTAGDGVSGGRFKVYDVSNAADIIALRPTDNKSTTYGRKTVYFNAPVGCSSVEVHLYCPSPNTGVAYFEDVSLALAEYSYTVTRNLDGTGANDWNAGDAVFNTGATGDGFIDLYSVHGIKAPSESGPTVVGNVRNSATYNDWTEHWAIGNLNGVYGYGVTTYGIGLGRYSAANYITIDDTNGVRFFDSGDVLRAQLSATDWTLGVTSEEHVAIAPGGLFIKDGATTYASLQAGLLALGDGDSEDHIEISAANGMEFWTYSGGMSSVAGYLKSDEWVLGPAASDNVRITSSVIQLRVGSAVNIQLDGSGNATFGNVAASQGNMYWNNTNKRVEFRGGTGGTVIEAYIDTDGSITAGGGVVKLNTTGISIEVATDKADLRAYQFIENGGTTVRGALYAWEGAATIAVELQQKPVASKDGLVMISSLAPSGQYARTSLGALGTGALGAYLYLYSGSVVGDYAALTADLRARKGLWVGSDNDPDDNDIHYDGNLKSYKNSVSEDVYAIQMYTSPKTHTSWDGDAVAVGTYPIDTSAWGCPVGIKYALVRLRMWWATAASGSWAGVKVKGGSWHSVIVIALVSNMPMEAFGLVPCDASGDFDVQVVGASTTSSHVQIWGFAI